MIKQTVLCVILLLIGLSLGNEISTSLSLVRKECLTSEMEFVIPINGQPRCCIKCPSGEGMAQLCTDNEETKCSPCIENLNFSNTTSAIEKCQMCTECQEVDKNSETEIACSRGTDTKCQCKQGFFRDETINKCKPCSDRCPDGLFITSQCTRKSDLKCGLCSEDEYLFRNATCQKCSVCGDNQITLRECNSFKDTLCCSRLDMDCMYSFFPEAVLGSSRQSQNYAIIVCCSILSLIIIFLGTCILYRLSKKHCFIHDNKKEIKNVENMIIFPVNSNVFNGKIQKNNILTDYKQIGPDDSYKTKILNSFSQKSQEKILELVSSIHDKAVIHSVKQTLKLENTEENSRDLRSCLGDSCRVPVYNLAKALRKTTCLMESKELIKLVKYSH